MTAITAAHRQRPVQMREQHRCGIGWHSRLPKQRRRKPVGVDVQEHQVVAAAIEPVGGQVHLLRRGQVDEVGVLRIDAAPASGAGPLFRPTQVHQDAGTDGHDRHPRDPAEPNLTRS
ncbi:hypothetical protein AFC81_03565 [Mycobacterium avium subsp. paratuberculosis]|uniref:Uncharacterized protein n=1 Tax=Mycolicibacterium paratuberculosis (strain ATCC BAA-968 / K-10) TaxID=262316 RepID=Q73W38_MYCPA|nr:hypothetical protein MAP_2822 [Mycobacterium avium subsp. paratuberculosis K-10]AGL35933.1 hypothetical protein MAP4_0990 [Mycobacterium avium subsp. paratuberculosis MAP4]AJK74435.1 hypothetical protein RC58_04870 [Mycobacterium avium subsp. paratuberculosis]AJK78592.1 hypothetical protein RE97_04865 [Mycobacterium avium subsp. paratuberculosis]ANH29455.1 hypothetical protein A0V42_14435 [Mycobacterium avium subsp. paratuberculosis]